MLADTVMEYCDTRVLIQVAFSIAHCTVHCVYATNIRHAVIIVLCIYTTFINVVEYICDNETIFQ